MTDRNTTDSQSTQQPVMMPAYFPSPPDEIDLIELVLQLWQGKIIILGAMIFAIVVGAGASVLSIKPPAPPAPIPTEYTVSTTFIHLVYPISAQKHCRGAINCLDAQANRDLSLFLNDDWLLSGDSLRIITDSPLAEQQYDEQLALVSDAATNKILTDARTELVIISDAREEILGINKLNPEFRGTEALLADWLNATRVITTIASGTPVITFKPTAIVLEELPEPPEPAKSKTPIILVISLILGCMLGSVIVLFKNALQSRRKQSTA